MYSDTCQARIDDDDYYIYSRIGQFFACDYDQE